MDYPVLIDGHSAAAGRAPLLSNATAPVEAPTKRRHERRLLIAFTAIVFGTLIPSQGLGVSWDEIVEMVTIVGGAAYILLPRFGRVGRPLLVLGGLSLIGALGILTHDEPSTVLLRCAYMGLFVTGLACASVVPQSKRSVALLIAGLGAAFGASLAAYLDMRGWAPNQGVQSGQEWREGARGLMSSRCPYTTLFVPLLVAYARRWRGGPYIVAAITIPYALIIAAGIGQGRGQTIEILVGAGFILFLGRAILIAVVGAVCALLAQSINWGAAIPAFFSAFAGRVGDTDLAHVDRIEHARLSLRLLGDASAQELMFGLPTKKIDLLIEGAGIHNGYLEPLVVGGFMAAVPLWVFFGYLMALPARKAWNLKNLDDATLASLSVIVQMAFVLLAAPLFWDWHSSWFFGIACGFACISNTALAEKETSVRAQ